MAAHEFLFAVELSEEAHFDSMLTELASAVLAHVGYSKTAAAEIRDRLRAALTDGLSKGHRRCDIQFRAHRGELRIAISYAGGRQWQTRRRLP